MLIHLKRNERLFVNGAVLRLDRRGTIELMNDAQFLLENHIMQPEGATTPLRQLYFVVQTMIVDPKNAHLTIALFRAQSKQSEYLAQTQSYLQLVKSVSNCVETENFFEALKMLRKSFSMEDELMGVSNTKFERGRKVA
jgi:flagellar biosynthesis repressor protein FlbT